MNEVYQDLVKYLGNPKPERGGYLADCSCINDEVKTLMCFEPCEGVMCDGCNKKVTNLELHAPHCNKTICS